MTPTFTVATIYTCLSEERVSTKCYCNAAQGPYHKIVFLNQVCHFQHKANLFRKDCCWGGNWLVYYHFNIIMPTFCRWALSLTLSLSLSLYIYIYIYLVIHRQTTDCFVVSKLFSVARHKLGSKPDWHKVSRISYPWVTINLKKQWDF